MATANQQKDQIVRMTYDDWMAEGKKRFGDDFMDWKFVCPVCGNIASVGDYKQFKEQGANPDSATQECIGRYQKNSSDAFGEKNPTKPCNYAGYGLFRLSPVRIVREDGSETHSFAFADHE